MTLQTDRLALEAALAEAAALRADLATATAQRAEAVAEAEKQHRAHEATQKGWRREQAEWKAERAALRAKLAEAENRLPAIHAEGFHDGTRASEAALTAALARAEGAETQRDYFRSIAKVELVAYGKLLEACGNSEPSAGHDVVDEVLGLLSVTRSQRDTAEAALSTAERERDEAREALAMRERFESELLLRPGDAERIAAHLDAVAHLSAALSRQRRVADALEALPDTMAAGATAERDWAWWVRKLAAELSEGT